MLDEQQIEEFLFPYRASGGDESRWILARLPASFDARAMGQKSVLRSVRFVDSAMRQVEAIVPVGKVITLQKIEALVGSSCQPENLEGDATTRQIERMRRSSICSGDPDLVVLDDGAKDIIGEQSVGAHRFIHFGGRYVVPVPVERIRSAVLRKGLLTGSIARAEPGPSHDGSLASITHRRVAARIDEMVDFVPFPATAMEIISLRFEKNFHASRLIDVIRRDPQLSAQLISWASSPGYSATEVASIDDAVSRVLGVSRALNMATALSIRGMVSFPQEFKSYISDAWRTTVTTALLAEAIAKALGPQFCHHSAYMSGLLHMMGMLLCSVIMPGRLADVVLHRTINPSATTDDIEDSILGVSTVGMAVTLLKKWGAPASVVAGIEHCRNPLAGNLKSPSAMITHLAIQKLYEMGAYPYFVPPQTSAILKSLGATSETLEQATAHLQENSEFIELFSRNIV